MSKRLFFRLCAVVLITGLTGCSTATYTYESKPVSGRAQTQVFAAAFTPEKENEDYFARFRLDVRNLSSYPIEIDWNRTAYLHEGTQHGRFAFQGIAPAAIREGIIPKDVIQPGTVFSKHIFPVAGVAMARSRDYQAGKTKPGLYSGILPAGANGILLAIICQEKVIWKTLSVRIHEYRN